MADYASYRLGSLARGMVDAVAGIGAEAVNDYLGLPPADPTGEGQPPLAALVVAAAREAGGEASRLDESALVIAIVRGGRELLVTVHDLGPSVALASQPVYRCRPGGAPDGLADYLLGRSAHTAPGGWARLRHGGIDHYYPRAVLPRAGLTVGALARAASALAGEASDLLAELGGA